MSESSDAVALDVVVDTGLRPGTTGGEVAGCSADGDPDSAATA
ncbi:MULTISPECIES: hypothetical protein [unclassified Gordonia (in: high G+C Gram-positive bacteria)]